MRDWVTEENGLVQVLDGGPDIVFELDTSGAPEVFEADARFEDAYRPTLNDHLRAPVLDGPVTITEFDPSEDVLALALPDATDDTVATTRPTADGKGTEVLIDGNLCATLPDVPDLAATDINLILF